MPAAFSADLLERQQVALLALAARIADEPGAAADERNRPCGRKRCSRARPMIGEQRPDVQARRGRVEADVGGDRSGRQRLTRGLRCWSCSSPRQRNSSRTFTGTTIPPRIARSGPRAWRCANMTAPFDVLRVLAPRDERRSKGCVATGVGLITGRVGYGVAYERHRVRLDERPTCASSACRRPSTACASA